MHPLQLRSSVVRYLSRRGIPLVWLPHHYGFVDSSHFILALSELQGAFVGGTILVVLLLVYKCLDIPYTNMTLAAARASDEAGLYYLHHICRWVIRGISAVQDLVTRSRSQNSTSGTELKPLRNIQSWYPEMVRATADLFM
jgi:hypothetical protein